MIQSKRHELKNGDKVTETDQRYFVKVYGVSGKTITTKARTHESALRISAKVAESVLVWQSEVLDLTGKTVFFIRQAK
jgi:hypothetical protein